MSTPTKVSALSVVAGCWEVKQWHLHQALGGYLGRLLGPVHLVFLPISSLSKSPKTFLSHIGCLLSLLPSYLCSSMVTYSFLHHTVYLPNCLPDWELFKGKDCIYCMSIVFHLLFRKTFGVHIVKAEMICFQFPFFQKRKYFISPFFLLF